MDFCIITPTSGLETYATRSRRHMVLAHQLVRDATYREFYLQRKAAGDFIIMDNGAYEKSYSINVFNQALQILQPNVACLPDVICSANSTAVSLDYLEHYYDQFIGRGIHWMFIPQGKDLMEWIGSLARYPDFTHVDPTVWIGLTRFLPTHVYQVYDIRVEAARWIKRRWPATRVHAMGMYNGEIDELQMLAEAGVESCDSSAPVWRGWKGYSLTDNLDLEHWNVKGTEVNFDMSLYGAKANLPLIEHNLEACLGACRATVQSRRGNLST